MTQVDFDDMVRDLPAYLHRVEGGEILVIVRSGKPVAEITPLTATAIKSLRQGRRPYGLCAGDFTVPDDFNDPLPDDVLADFEGQ